jgi:thymidylate synthase
MLGELLKPIVDYLKGQPFNNVLIAALLGVIVWAQMDRREQARESHNTFHQVLKERDARDDKKTDQLISVLTGVRQEQKKTTAAVNSIPEATAKIAADKIEEAKAAESGTPGID